MSKRDFLLEIGLEEMPARFVTDAMNQLKDKIAEWLQKDQLAYDSISAYSTPRRLAVIVNGLSEKQEDIEEVAKGPAKKIAQDETGNWTKAAIGFARGQGVSTEDLFFQEVSGVEYVFAKKFTVGQETVSVLGHIEEIIKGLHFPKNMRWNHYDLRFVRPIQWMIALYGNEVIPFEITTVKTDRLTYGHRFLGKQISIKDSSEYESSLLKEYVIVDPVERKEAVRKQLALIEEENNWVVPVDEDLLEEVNNLIEYPTALFGSFDESFLAIPDEVLITSMREHQRYFPVQNKEGKLLPHFITVRNGDHQYIENVVRGNEKVLRARLSDAQFFYNEDQKLKIEDALSRLENIVYHVELGSLGDKVRRIEAISENLVTLLNVCEKDEVLRAAKLCKFDLVTQMVYEFPELQGRMGEEYALKAGENEKVAKAIQEHYKPKFSGDSSPESMVGVVVSIADKLDTITTCFAIGLIPTGSQDPYALRRQAAGIVQMLIDHKLDVELEQLLHESVEVAEKRNLLKRDKEEILSDLVEFFKLRVKNTLQEQGVRYDVIDAVLTKKISKVEIMVRKAQFLNQQLNVSAFKEVVESLSRVTNISSKATVEVEISAELFEKEEERKLFELHVELNEKLPTLLQNGDIAQAYQSLSELKEGINNYFDHIMVMAENEEIKNNRLSQMKQLADTIKLFANFQVIVFS